MLSLKDTRQGSGGLSLTYSFRKVPVSTMALTRSYAPFSIHLLRELLGLLSSGGHTPS